MDDFDAGIKTSEKAPAARVRLGNQDLMSTHGQSPRVVVSFELSRETRSQCSTYGDGNKQADHRTESVFE
jgi:hypothetical protein